MGGKNLSNPRTRALIRGLIWHAAVLMSASAVGLMSYLRDDIGVSPVDVLILTVQAAVICYQVLQIWNEPKWEPGEQIALLSTLSLACFAALDFLRLMQRDPPATSRVFLVITAAITYAAMTALEAPNRSARIHNIVQIAPPDVQRRVASSSLVLNGAISLGALLWCSVEVIDAANVSNDLRVLVLILLCIDAVVFVVAATFTMITIETFLSLPSPVQRAPSVPLVSNPV
jgi:hypothetical protein